MLRASGNALQLTTYGPLAGQLLLRAFDRADRIHGAMLARGFDGEVRTLRAMHWTRRDSLFVAGWGALLLLVRSVDLPQWLGTLLLGAAP
jgi:cobalt/nickel transport system permease protein